MDHDLIHTEEDVDDLISDIHQLIDDEPPAEPPAETPVEEAPLPEPEPEPQPESVPEPEPASEPAVEEPFLQQRWTERQKVPKHVAKLQQHQEEAYARWLQEQEEKGEEAPPVFEEEQPKKKKKREKQPEPQEVQPQPAEQPEAAVPRKKRRFATWFCLILALLTVTMAALTVFAVPQQPLAQSEYIHAAGTSTILLAGTDASYGRTPMLMLLSINPAKGRLSLVSIPGDTLIPEGEGAVKLNAVYGLAGGGSVGIAALEKAISACVGFVPDGTLVLHPESVTAFVDTLADVSYNGEALTGSSALALLTGGEEASMELLQTQRSVLARLISRCRSTDAVLKAPLLLEAICQNAVTDMTTENLLWLARAAMTVDSANAEMVTLPGTADEAGSYYLDGELAVQTVNAYCNPYIRAIGEGDLNIFAQGE